MLLFSLESSRWHLIFGNIIVAASLDTAFSLFLAIKFQVCEVSATSMIKTYL